MSCQHFNLSLRFDGPQDKELPKKRRVELAVFIYTLLAAKWRPQKLIEKFPQRHSANSNGDAGRKEQIMQQFHFDIFVNTGWKDVNVNDCPQKKPAKKGEKKNF